MRVAQSRISQCALFENHGIKVLLPFPKRVNNGISYVLVLDSEKVGFQLNMDKGPPVIPKTNFV